MRINKAPIKRKVCQTVWIPRRCFFRGRIWSYGGWFEFTRLNLISIRKIYSGGAKNKKLVNKDFDTARDKEATMIISPKGLYRFLFRRLSRKLLSHHRMNIASLFWRQDWCFVHVGLYHILWTTRTTRSRTVDRYSHSSKKGKERKLTFRHLDLFSTLVSIWFTFWASPL